MDSAWLSQRSAGVILHPTALPGPTGIGTFGEKAYRWIEYLSAAGFKYWQTLPMGITSYSPYQCFSAFAGNPYMIDLPALVGEGLLSDSDLACFGRLGDTKVDFAAQNALRWGVLKKAYENFKRQPSFSVYGDFNTFRQHNADWLRPFALYAALKTSHADRAWMTWEPQYRSYAEASKLSDKDRDTLGVEAHEFYQYLFLGQWQRLKNYAGKNGIQIIGDIPIYVLQDSADVWANPELFDLDPTGAPKFVAGCPPDYFDENGQHWGNPLYNWEAHKKTGYAWWLKRLQHTLEFSDVIRIDHFRAFYDYWMIPSSAKTAKEGHWGQGPKMDFFKAVFDKMPRAAIIAEDLGDLHDGVRAFLKETGLPGMTILQFAFGGDAQNLYLPHNALHNQVAYTGTHDNDTLAGWIENAKDHETSHALTYLNCHKGVFVESAVRSVLASVSRLAIIPAQDLLGLGSSARFNIPGVADNNWDWRMTGDMFARLEPKRIREVLKLFGRA